MSVYTYTLTYIYQELKFGLVMGLVEALLEILNKPSIGEFMVGILVFMGPVWIAFLLGLMVGWAWKPRWVSSVVSKFKFLSPALGSPSEVLATTQTSDLLKVQTKGFDSSVMGVGLKKEQLFKLQYKENSTVR